LRKLILSFEREYADAATRMRELLRTGNNAEAERLAHSLKGVAATLELRDLNKAAQDMEQALREDQGGNLDALIQDFESALTPALVAARDLANTADVGGQAPDNPH